MELEDSGLLDMEWFTYHGKTLTRLCKAMRAALEILLPFSPGLPLVGETAWNSGSLTIQDSSLCGPWSQKAQLFQNPIHWKLSFITGLRIETPPTPCSRRNSHAGHPLVYALWRELEVRLVARTQCPVLSTTMVVDSRTSRTVRVRWRCPQCLRPFIQRKTAIRPSCNP